MDRRENMDRREIMEVKTYVDPEGREVREFIQVFGKDKEANFYKGGAIMRIQGLAPNGMPVVQNRRFEFLFPQGTSLKRAFETFDQVAKTEMDSYAALMKEEVAKNKVVGARAMPPLLGPDGKPMKG